MIVQPKPRYEIEGRKYYSVTQILHKGLPTPPSLIKWLDSTPNAASYTRDRATIGTITHWKIQRFLARKFNLVPDIINLDDTSVLLHDDTNCKEKCSLCKRHKIMVAAIDVIWSYWVDFFESNKIEPIFLEKTVWDSELGYAGTLDFFGYVNDVLTLMDFKTFKALYDDHSYGAQQAAYSHCLAKQGNKPNQIALLRLNERTGYEFIPILENWDLFERALTEFYKKVNP
jgi:hypothetical protein|tara:strand:+ start:210 stop:896 length:687 start_codon:yes stop_codon:yes gene_type:complete